MKIRLGFGSELTNYQNQQLLPTCQSKYPPKITHPRSIETSVGGCVGGYINEILVQRLIVIILVLRIWLDWYNLVICTPMIPLLVHMVVQ
jgi:hypothetical protein